LMEDFTLVISSYDGPQFRFPDMAAFANPVLPKANIQLPAQSGGVVKGLNCYGKWRIDNSGKQGKLLRNLLGLEPVIALTAQISSPVQEKSSFYASINTTINGNCPFIGELGVAMNQGTPEFYAAVNTTVKIGGRKCNFDMTMSFVATGAYFTGSMVGTIKAGGVQLSNLVLMTGLSYAGVPSLGVAGTIDIKDISSSIALFFDGNDPSKSVFAGAISDISLAEITSVFANVKKLPKGIGKVLKQINLSGTGEFVMPAKTTTALDDLDLSVVSAAFNQHGGIKLTGGDSTLSLVIKTAGKKWSLTDLGDMMKHYSIEKTSKGIVVSLDAQVYVAP
ncbi:MAG: hypothetical protein MJK04_07670, partial [Psychrosphaera sp.]|nr:hypothetical protein [Psychrosphaera sp.]